MKRIIIATILLISTLLPQEIYKKVKIFPSTNEGFAPILQYAFDLEESTTDKDGSIKIFLNSKEFSELQNSGLRYEVLIPDWQVHYNNLPTLMPEEKLEFLQESKAKYGIEGFGFGSMGGFYTFQEAINQLDSLHARYPNIITQKFQIGVTENGRPIWAAKISDNPNVSEPEPRALFDGLIHAREPISMMTVIYAMYYLCENYGDDPEVTYLVDNREIFFIPVVNPDGYEYNRVSNPNGGGLWRKNRKNSGGGAYGVDLNRNYGYMWGYDNTGSSPTPSSETYRGPSAFSEPEVAAIRDLTVANGFKTYVNFHSYANAMLFPWGFINQVTPDNVIYSDFCSYMSKYNGFVYGNGGTILGYNSNGSSRDWFYGEQTTKPKTFGYTFEIGGDADDFWPPQSRIFPLVQLNLRPILFKSWVAGEYVSFFAPHYDREYFNPGDIVTMSAVVKNRGLSAASNVMVELVSISSDITVINGSAQILNIASQDTVPVPQPFSFSISSQASFNQQHRLLVKTKKDNVTMSLDTLTITLGVPNYIFIDSTDTPLNHWTVTATPVSSPKWEATTASFVSAPASFTDSKSGMYSNNAAVTMTTTNPIDLSAVTNPKLTYWLKHDIESNYDYAQVMISTNGGALFTPLAGRYTTVSSGSFQPPNQPVYDGICSTWVQEEIPLLPYSGQQVLLRFILVTDGTQQKDGIYIDDIGIIGYSPVPVELTSFSGMINSNSGNPELSWTVASELNNKGFEIQRSFDGFEWAKSGFVEGRGTSLAPHTYHFEDKTSNVSMENIWYRLKQFDFDGTTLTYAAIQLEPVMPTEFSLKQNFPNPFNPSTRIAFTLPQKSQVKITVFDQLGSVLSILANGEYNRGSHFVDFDASNLASGLYFYRIEIPSKSITGKMLLIR